MLLGRESERRVLERLVAGARVGTSGVLTITGDPGVGKSTLLDHAAGLAEGMILLRVVGSAPEHEVSFGGLQQLLHPATDLLDRIPAPQAEALGSALALRPGSVADRFTVGVATLSLLCRFAEDRPVAVIVDDAHWLDVASAEAIAFAARRLVADPIVLVAASRDTAGAELSRYGLPQLRLLGLDRTTTRELLDRRYAVRLPESMVDRLHRATGGNPLAILELADVPSLVEQVSPAVPVPLSTTLAEGFAGRTAGLQPAARRALLVASTEGGRTPVILHAVRSLGGGPQDLVEVEDSGLITVVDDRIAFRHPLVRSAVYTQALPAERRQAHRAVADAIADCGAGHQDEQDRRAWHLAEAAIGPDPEVAGLLEAVAARASRRGAHAAAASALDRAARLSGSDAESAPRLLGAGEAALLAGRPVRAVELLDRARVATLDRQTRVRALALRGAVMAQGGSLVESRDILLAAADLAGEADTRVPDLAITLLTDALQAAFFLADGPGAGAIARRLEALVPLARDSAIRDMGTLAAGIARVLSGEGGLEQIREAVDALTAARALEADPLHLGWLLMGPLWLREAGAGRLLVQRVAGEVRDRAEVAALPYLLFLLGRDDATTQRWAEAASSYAEGIRLARETGRVPDLIASLAGLAWLEARQGREAACRSHAAEVLRECAPRRIGLFRVWALFALGELELGLGRPGEAEGHFEELQAVLQESGLADVDLSPVPELVEVRLRLDRSAASTDDATQLLWEAEAKGQPWALARAHRAMALVTTTEEAERHFCLAVEHHARTLDTFESARTSLAFGSWLRRSRHRVRSRPVLREALDAFERLGALPWADIAATELAATGQTVHRRAADTLDQLTPQQLQIARLLAAGRTTRQAAAALFVSRKTVEYHLRNVYLKLGISPREELTETMRSSGLGGCGDGERRGRAAYSRERA
ncbi:LuxR family transcriptional regulator [soil metagenome]